MVLAEVGVPVAAAAGSVAAAVVEARHVMSLVPGSVNFPEVWLPDALRNQQQGLAHATLDLQMHWDPTRQISVRHRG